MLLYSLVASMRITAMQPLTTDGVTNMQSGRLAGSYASISARNLRFHGKKRHWTQEYLEANLTDSFRMSCSTSLISNVERGEPEFSLTEWEVIANEYNVHPLELIADLPLE